MIKLTTILAFIVCASCNCWCGDGTLYDWRPSEPTPPQESLPTKVYSFENRYFVCISSSPVIGEIYYSTVAQLDYAEVMDREVVDSESREKMSSPYK